MKQYYKTKHKYSFCPYSLAVLAEFFLRDDSEGMGIFKRMFYMTMYCFMSIDPLQVLFCILLSGRGD